MSSKRITVQFDPKTCDIIPTIHGQSRVLPDGTVEAWFDERQGEDALLMAERLKQALEENEVLLPAPK